MTDEFQTARSEQPPVISSAGDKTAVLYRMVTPDHICPFGLKSKALLKRKGFAVEDMHLRSREETDAFKQKHGLNTTPQIFIDGARVGGYEDLKQKFGIAVPGKDATTYTPVIAIFAMALAMAVAATWASSGLILTVRTAEWFIAFAMCLLALQKLRDLRSFSNQFLGYDLLAQRFVRYAYFYPFAEGVAGVLMIAGVLIWLAAPLAIFIGLAGAVSVFKAV